MLTIGLVAQNSSTHVPFRLYQIGQHRSLCTIIIHWVLSTSCRGLLRTERVKRLLFDLYVETTNRVNLDRPYSRSYPDVDGYYGHFDGNYYPSEVGPALRELASTYEELRTSTEFQNALEKVRMGLQGRPTPVHHLEKLSSEVGSAQLYVKPEDRNHTGAHRINHCVGFALLAKKMGKTSLLAETGAGQHGVALASAAHILGLNVRFTWARSISRNRARTSDACSHSARVSYPQLLVSLR